MGPPRVFWAHCGVNSPHVVHLIGSGLRVGSTCAGLCSCQPASLQQQAMLGDSGPYQSSVPCCRSQVLGWPCVPARGEHDVHFTNVMPGPASASSAKMLQLVGLELARAVLPHRVVVWNSERRTAAPSICSSFGNGLLTHTAFTCWLAGCASPIPARQCTNSTGCMPHEEPRWAEVLCSKLSRPWCSKLSRPWG